MGQDSQNRDKWDFGPLVALARIPVGLLGGSLVLLFFLCFLVLETLVDLVCFPIAAIFFDKADIRGSWMGGYPHALREFENEGFKHFGIIWRWVKAPIEPEGGPTLSPQPTQVNSGTREENPLELALGCLVLLALVGGVGYGAYALWR